MNVNDRLATAVRHTLRVLSAQGCEMFWEYSELLAALDEWERAQVDEAKAVAASAEVM